MLGGKYRYLEPLVVRADQSIVPIPDQVERLHEYIKVVFMETGPTACRQTSTRSMPRAEGGARRRLPEDGRWGEACGSGE